MTRDPNDADLLSRLGAQPLVADVLDRDATAAAIRDARPDVVVDQLTASPRSYTPESMRATLAATRAVRTIGGDNVYSAAVAAGARRYVAQSGCSYYRPGVGLADESEPWVEHGPPLVAAGVSALIAVEPRTLRPNGPLAGVARRYGFFYGPGTWFHPDGNVAAQMRAGQYPVLGTGAGRSCTSTTPLLRPSLPSSPTSRRTALAAKDCEEQFGAVDSADHGSSRVGAERINC